MIVELLYVGFVALASLFLLRKWARTVGLVDKQNERKLHDGNIPLVGGIAVFIAISQFLYVQPDIMPNSIIFLSLSGCLVFLGAVDDKFDVSYKIRLAIQIIIGSAMVSLADLRLLELGDLFGTGDIRLNTFFSFSITVIAIVSAINAFNMVDGIDGLLGGLSIVTFSALGALTFLDMQSGYFEVCLVFIAGLIPYVALNLGLFDRRRKVFMGDAGSMMIGFSVVWLLLAASQQEPNTFMRPVTALWLIAIPLMDMSAIMIRRIKRGESPFRPDRTHLHHVCQSFGLSSSQTLCFICSLASLLSAIGIFGELVQVPEVIMFFSFIALFIIYVLTLVRLDIKLKKSSN